MEWERFAVREFVREAYRWVDAELAPRFGEAAGRGSCSLQFELSALVTSLGWGGSFPLLSRSCRNEPALGGLGDAVAGLSDASRGSRPTTTNHSERRTPHVYRFLLSDRSL